MVVKSKQRVKKSAIKKWEQTYTVPIPYFGLMQIERDTRSSRYGNTENDTQVQYWGSIEKVFEGIPIAVSVSIRGEIEYFDIGNTDSMYEDDIPKEEYYRRRSLSQDNSSGASVAYYSGRVVIRDPSTDSDHSAIYYNYIAGTGRDYGGPDFGSFMSIEDAINHVGEVVEDFFPKVMEYVNQEKMASTKKSQKVSKMAKGQAISKADYMTLLKLKQCLSNIQETAVSLYEDLDSLVNNEYETLIGGPVPNGYDFKIMGIRDTVKFSILAGLDAIMENCDDGVQYEASTKKSQKASKMAKRQAIKKREPLEVQIEEWIDDIVHSPYSWSIGSRGEEMVLHCRGYERWFNKLDIVTEQDIQQAKDNLRQNLTNWEDSPVSRAYHFGEISEEEYGRYNASTKKSKYAKLHKALNKIGGFTKEDDEDEEVEIEVDVDDEDDSEEEETVEVESNEDESEKGCKSAKAFRTSKRVKMKKGEDMPADADDFQNDNQKGSGNAGSELPEDADDQQDENDPGSGNAGKELPEDANEQEDQKQARARKMRKFSVTPGGQPNQESYNQRYSQAPMVRQAIDGHFSAKSEKSFDEVQMMQDRIDEIIKSKRNKTNNGVPQKIRRY